MLRIAVLALTLSACGPLGTIFGRNIAALSREPRVVPNKVTEPVRRDARLAALWIGHASLLIQIDDKIILTDPVLTETVGQFSRRLVEPGIEIENLPAIDLVAISHNHIDHLSYASLDLIEPKVDRLVTARGGLVYMPNYRFPIGEVAPWKTVSIGAMKVTAVPVDHQGFRYGADYAWMDNVGFTGWVFEYRGLTVYFGGDTAYAGPLFRETAARFGDIDLAIIPIGPIEPAEMARANHLDGRQAIQAFIDLGARHMIPMHYDTFPHGADAIGDAPRMLRTAMRQRGLGPERVHVLAIGEQRVFIPRHP